MGREHPPPDQGSKQRSWHSIANWSFDDLAHDLWVSLTRMSERPSHPPSRGRASVSVAPSSVELTSAQIDRIVRDALGTGNVPVLLSGLDGARQNIQDNQRLLDDPRMSRSLLLGLMVLCGFPADGGEVGVVALANQLGLGASTTHRYVATLLSVGLVERDPSTRLYRLAR